MKLKLKADAQKIRSYIEKRVRDYPVYVNLGPGENADPIRLITLGYHLEQAGYFALVFDTRSDATSDGQWTLHIENEVNLLNFPRWCTAFEKLCDGGTVEVTLPNGEHRTLDDSDDNTSVAQLFGEMLRDIMFSLRDSNAFDTLPIDPNAYFIIEEFDGLWGWPDYNNQKTMGRLKDKTASK